MVNEETEVLWHNEVEKDEAMLQVSERSWHLRYVRWCQHFYIRLVNQVFGPSEEPDLYPYHYEPKNLCGYFWVVVLSGPSILLLTTTLMPFLLALKWLFIVISWLLRHFFDLLVAVYHCIRKPAADDTIKQPGTVKQPGLLLAYLRAKKRRICPLIKVVP